MLFNSIEYFTFFLLTLFIHSIIKNTVNLRFIFLLAASYFFYFFNNGNIIILLLISTLIDYIAGIVIDKYSDRPVIKKISLMFSLIGNLGMLGFFKYYNFFCDNASFLFSIFGYKISLHYTNVILPVGISFYTFQTLSYTIDVYRGNLKVEKNFIKFAFYVTYFPQLIAGPIVRASEFIPQLYHKAKITNEDINFALYKIANGLLKKIIFADSIAFYADKAFNNPAGIDSITALIGVYSFAFQIYFDFSGYSDIAIGCAKLMGFNIPDNFNNPYMSTSLTDFWRRWHISLSTWLKDYLYITLGGNRMKTKAGVYRNLMITMLLGGLWHGANWTFIVWGGIQGLALSIEKFFNLYEFKKTKFTILTRKFLVFHLVCFSWIIFRAASLRDAVLYCKSFLNFDLYRIFTYGEIFALSIIVIGFIMQFLSERFSFRKRFLNLNIFIQSFIYAIIVCLILIFSNNLDHSFIYFQF